MKHLKKDLLHEKVGKIWKYMSDFKTKPKWLEDAKNNPIAIIAQLNDDGNAKYSLSKDGKVNVNGNVKLSHKNLIDLPIRFGKVTGDFFINSNKITSLEGCPFEVGGVFECAGNLLKSLQYAPSIVGKDLYCSNNKLISLEGGPSKVGKDFDCSFNKLTTLEGCPPIINGDLSCEYNKLISFKGAPRIIKKDFTFNNNKLISLEGCPEKVGGQTLVRESGKKELINKIRDAENWEEVYKNHLLWSSSKLQDLNKKIGIFENTKTFRSKIKVKNDSNLGGWVVSGESLYSRRNLPVFFYSKTQALALKKEIDDGDFRSFMDDPLWKSSKKLQDMNKKTGIFENVNYNEVKIVEELRNYKGSEYFMTAYATLDKKYVGHCDYSIYKKDVSIKYLFVVEEFRKKGIASQLLDFVKKEYSDKLIDYGYSTDDGAKFMDSYLMSKKKKLLKVGELLNDKGYRLMKERNKDLTIKENIEKDIAIIAFNNNKVEFSEEDCLNLANKYDMFYNQSENGFIVKLRTLNDLKALIRNSEDLEIESPEYHIFTDDSRYEADFEEIVKNIDKNNLKKIKYLYSVDFYESDKLPVDLISKVLKAANDAYNDYINTKVQSVVFDKLYKTGYFKQYSSNVNYKIEHGFYILLATPKFLEESVEHQIDYIERNGGKDFATATIFNIFENINNQIFLSENDFDLKLEKEFFNQCLEMYLKDKGK